MNFSKMSKGQKALSVFAVLYIVYGIMFMGETVGLLDAGTKFQGKKAGPVQAAAANWAGVGALVVGADCLFAALRGSAAIVQRTLLINAMSMILRIGIFAAHGSDAWGGATVHKEYVQGFFITVGVLFVSMNCLLDGVPKAKNPFTGCDSLTHGALIIPFFFYTVYMGMFLLSDFPSQQYVAPKGGFRSTEPGLYVQMPWTVSMWIQVMLQILVLLSSGKAAEQREFALSRVPGVLASIYLMIGETAITVPQKAFEGKIVQGLCLAAYLVSGFGDKIKPKSKAPAKRAASTRKKK
jgi:hypothetical protein